MTYFNDFNGFFVVFLYTIYLCPDVSVISVVVTLSFYGIFFRFVKFTFREELNNFFVFNTPLCSLKIFCTCLFFLKYNDLQRTSLHFQRPPCQNIIKVLSSQFKHHHTQLAYQDYQGIQHTAPIQHYAMSSLEPPQDRFTLFKCIRFYSHIHFRKPRNSTPQSLSQLELKPELLDLIFLERMIALVVITSVGNKGKLCRNTKHKRGSNATLMVISITFFNSLSCVLDVCWDSYTVKWKCMLSINFIFWLGINKYTLQVII